MWLYYCLLSTVISGFTTIAMKKCSNNEQKRLAVMGVFLYHLIILISAVAIKPSLVFNLNIIDMIEMLPGIIMQTIGFVCAFFCLKHGKVAVTSPIKKCNTVVAFLLGILALKESFTIVQIIISLILFILSIMLGIQYKKLATADKKAERKSILYAYGFALFNGCSSVLNKVYVAKFEDPSYVLINYAIIAIIGVIIYCIVTKQWSYIDIRKMNAKRYFLLQSLLDASSSILNRFSMLDGNVSVISVIQTSSIVITILASRFILNEKISWKKYLMILGIFICVVALALIK